MLRPKKYIVEEIYHYSNFSYAITGVLALNDLLKNLRYILYHLTLKSNQFNTCI